MTRRNDLHESFERKQISPSASPRGFGIVFAVVFFAIGLLPLLNGRPVRWWAVAIAVLLSVIALLRPQVLRSASRAWHWIGELLHTLVTPLILGALFYLTVVPTGLVMRILGKDPLRLKFEPGASSYWIHRRPPGPAPGSMRDQF